MNAARGVYLKYGTFRENDWNAAKASIGQHVPILVQTDKGAKFGFVSEFSGPLLHEREVVDEVLRSYLCLR